MSEDRNIYLGGGQIAEAEPWRSPIAVSEDRNSSSVTSSRCHGAQLALADRGERGSQLS